MPPSPYPIGSISKCVLTAEVTLSGPLDLGAVCLHLPSICRCQGKRKVIFCVWPAGKAEANDLGHVDCYLAPRIALCFLEKAPGTASSEDEKGWVRCLLASRCECWGRCLGHPPTHTHTQRAQRSQVCSVIIMNVCVRLLITALYRSTLMHLHENTLVPQNIIIMACLLA